MNIRDRLLFDDCLDADGDMETVVVDYGQEVFTHLTKAEAAQIVEHLKKVFSL